MQKIINLLIVIPFIICVSFVSIGTIFSRPIFLFTLYFIICLLSIATTFLLKKKLFSMRIIVRILFVMLIAFFIRAIAIYFLNLTQQGDYAVYLSIAHKISNNTLDNALYFGIFPHSLNYPIFLSSFYKIIGEVTWLPRVINLVFGVLETGLAVFIMEKTISPKLGIISGLAVALNPSIIVFTLLSGAEPIYASLIMCALFFLVLSNDELKKSYIFLALSGFFCAASNFFRPTGIILIIAIVMQIFLRKYTLKVKLFKSLIIIISFFALTAVMGNITSTVSGYKQPANSFGWNLFIGANDTSIGKWNAEDATVFNEIKDEYDDPSKVQSYFAHLGIARYKSMGLKAFKHFYKKLSVWTEEKFTLNAITYWQTSYTRFKSTDMQQTYNLLINFYNTFVIFGVMITLIFVALTNHAPDNIKTLSLYIIGSMLLFMVLETAGRYKGAYYSSLTILSVYGFFVVLPNIKVIMNRSLFRFKQPSPSTTIIENEESIIQE